MIDFLFILIYIVLAAALGATAWSVYHKIRIVGKTSGKMHGIPVRRINTTVVVIMVLLMLLSFLLGSTAPMHINTSTYEDTLWLRISNMFVFTGVAAIIAASAAMLYSYFVIISKRR